MWSEVSASRARRIAIRAQRLDGRSDSVLDCVRQLGFLQLDPTGVVPAQHLVLWSRIAGYRPADLDRLLWATKELFQWRAHLWPREALPALRSVMARYLDGDSAWPTSIREWLAANATFKRYVLDELAAGGPLLSRQLEDRAEVPWSSAGWTGNRNVGQMLEFLNCIGEVAIVGQVGKQRLWDLAERWYPAGEPLPPVDADAWLADHRARSLGVTHRDGAWFAPAGADDRPVSRTTLLSPFDRLIHDRGRCRSLFGFDYKMEIYVPKAKRQYGYFVLPVLHRDRLAGRIDPTYDRRTRTLQINAVFWEGKPVDLTRPVTSLARYLGAETITRPGDVGAGFHD